VSLKDFKPLNNGKMKNEKMKIIALFLLGFGITTVNAQQAITTTGSSVSDSGGTVAYTIGQIAYTSYSNTKGTITQGVQQSYKISTELGIDNHSINLELITYPNPTTNFFTLSVGSTLLTNLNFELYDINGRLIENRKITSPTETIRMEDLTSATYFLKVTDNNKELKIFKVIKN
jgi:hypothetical protein